MINHYFQFPPKDTQPQILPLETHPQPPQNKSHCLSHSVEKSWSSNLLFKRNKLQRQLNWACFITVTVGAQNVWSSDFYNYPLRPFSLPAHIKFFITFFTLSILFKQKVFMFLIKIKKCWNQKLRRYHRLGITNLSKSYSEKNSAACFPTSMPDRLSSAFIGSLWTGTYLRRASPLNSSKGHRSWSPLKFTAAVSSCKNQCCL